MVIVLKFWWQNYYLGYLFMCCWPKVIFKVGHQHLELVINIGHQHRFDSMSSPCPYFKLASKLSEMIQGCNMKLIFFQGSTYLTRILVLRKFVIQNN